MKAAVIHEFGDFEALKYEDVETPKPKPGNVLVKVLAAGINRFDHYIREGSVTPELQLSFRCPPAPALARSQTKKTLCTKTRDDCNDSS